MGGFEMMHTWTRKPAPLAVRFWLKVVRLGLDECWVWQGSRIPGSKRAGRQGYGVLAAGSPRRASLYAHRVSWEMHHGSIPQGLLVLHRCDNPPCVNPAHLYLGTHAENMADMVARGRQRNAATVER